MNNLGIKVEILKEVRKDFEVNYLDYVSKLWVTDKAVFMGKFIALNTHVGKC